jgi:Family of unknown function (DUF6152)
VSNGTRRLTTVTGIVGAMLLGVMVAPALSHHSFAMYDQTTTRVMTGKLTRYVPGANHAQLIFELLDEQGQPVVKDGKPVTWGVEAGSAVAMSRRGVTRESFPEGTIFTVRLYPLRDGRNFGALAGMLIKCGKVVPKGGCTKETGEALIGEEFDAR